MIAVGGVGVLLFGMVLFGAVTAWKNIPEPEPPPRPERQLAYAPIGPTPSVDTSKSSTDKSKPAPDTKSNKKEPSNPDTKKKSNDKGKSNKPKPKKSKNDKGKKDQPKAETADKSDEAAPDTQVALNSTTPKPTLTPVTSPIPVTWGMISGFPGDCSFQPDAEGLTISIPGTLHVLSPDLKVKNAPHLLAEAGGDFTAQVQIVGKLQPGIEPLEVPIAGAKPKDAKKDKKDKKDKKNVFKFPGTFQGAGLLLWKDPNNYIRFERIASYDVMAGKKSHQLMVESCKDGKVNSTEWRDFRESDVPMTLRVVRKGSDLRCSYSPDRGKTWIDVKRLQQVALPDQIQIGVTAANVAPKTFAARFENFDLSR